ncbi:DUF4127 family protein [Streptosporangium sp. NBC_01756]|uniref:DUF4127 family protein n=1 Tax=Streptosporangium sp. NBC_01756 TaxID=2975950 RepID=UPI002DDA65AB|nr:DUF4127 family protein [Streptosporangium sp. NBC_01756]WSC90346.1 DUF4127 family protein [Streptosporangium sp. NBC_01756]
MHIALLPLDERPVNTRLPADVAAIAGARVSLPDTGLLPSMRTPGKVGLLGQWLLDQRMDAAVVSVDMLVYGGLIPARTTSDDTLTVLERLDVLRRLRQARPGLPVSAVSLVTRASDSYHGDEEPSYWPRFGRELHAYGGLLHRLHLADLTGDEPPADEHTGRIPAEIRSDFELRRLRNHVVNLEVLRLLAEGVVDPLLVTADDTAVHSAGSVEQSWLRHWARSLDPAGTLLMYPGADEVGAVLVARALAAQHGRTIRIRVVGGDPAGLDAVAPYENLPAAEGARRQILAAGARVAENGENADVVLVLHTPDPRRTDWLGTPPVPDAVAVAATIRAVREADAPVALADIRHANGGDPELVTALQAEGLIDGLVAYGGWNTAGNTIGSVVAAAVATVIGSRENTLDRTAARRLLLHRLTEDYGYQAIVRATGPDAAAAGRRLAPILRGLDPDWTIGDVAFPWNRSFEIDFTLARREPRGQHPDETFVDEGTARD